MRLNCGDVRHVADRAGCKRGECNRAADCCEGHDCLSRADAFGEETGGEDAKRPGSGGQQSGGCLDAAGEPVGDERIWYAPKIALTVGDPKIITAKSAPIRSGGTTRKRGISRA